MATLTASVSVMDGDGGEAVADGVLRVTPGDDPGTVALWVGLADDVAAGIIVSDREALMAALAAVGMSAMSTALDQS